MAILRQSILQQNMMVPKMFQQNLNFYDCKLISSEGRQKLTNKIVLASKSKFLSQLLGELPQCSDSVVIFPDYALEDIEILLECIVDTESSRESRLINDLLVIHNHKKPSLDPTEVIDDLKACPVISVEENCDVDDQNAVQEIDRNDKKYNKFERSLKNSSITLNCEDDSLASYRYGWPRVGVRLRGFKGDRECAAAKALAYQSLNWRGSTTQFEIIYK